MLLLLTQPSAPAQRLLKQAQAPGSETLALPAEWALIPVDKRNSSAREPLPPHVSLPMHTSRFSLPNLPAREELNSDELLRSIVYSTGNHDGAAYAFVRPVTYKTDRVLIGIKLAETTLVKADREDALATALLLELGSRIGETLYMRRELPEHFRDSRLIAYLRNRAADVSTISFLFFLHLADHSRLFPPEQGPVHFAHPQSASLAGTSSLPRSCSPFPDRFSFCLFARPI